MNSFRIFSFILLIVFTHLSSSYGASPGVGWVQEENRWRVLSDTENTHSLEEENAPDFKIALALMNEARREQNEDNRGDALDLYGEVVDDYPHTLFAPEALYQRGIICTQSHQFEDANAQFNALVEQYPGYPKFDQVIEKQFALAEMIQNGARPYYGGIIPGLRNKQTAIDVYENLIQNAPFSKYAPVALMNIAIVANEDDKPEEAIDALDRLIHTYPNSLVTDDAYLKLAQTYASIVKGPEYDQAATMQAISYYQDYLILFPQAEDMETAKEELKKMRETLAESKYELGDFYYGYRDNKRAALTFYNETISTFPNSQVAAKAREKIELINAGVKAPMTPVDWVFGRYKEPSLKEYLEQSEVDNLEDENFQIQSTEAFLETPGAVALEEFTPGMPPQEYEGIGVPLDPYFYDEPYFYEPIAPYEDDFMDPYPWGGPPFLEVLQPYQAPGPTTPEQQAINKEKQEKAQNQDLPAGDQ